MNSKARMLMLDQEEEEEEMEIELLACLALSSQNKKARKWWCHPLTDQRLHEGAYHRLMKELDAADEMFKNYFRLSKDQFEYVLSMVSNVIGKEDTRLRKSISARERLAVTLRYLATGETFKSLSYSYRIASCTISSIVKEVCSALWDMLQPLYMKFPSSQEEWMDIAEDFEKTWQFPNCCGAIDGKHVMVQAPPNTGSLFYNYKGTFSIVLLAAVDAKYRFITIDVGSCGMNNDSGIFRASKFGQALRNEKLDLPPDRLIPGAEDIGALPYVFVADEGLPLLKKLMRPYGGRGRTEDERVFNYHLSRARRIVESGFGILAARWRVFYTKILVHPDVVKDMVKATCFLHNYIQATSSRPEGNNLEDMTQENRLPGLASSARRGNRIGEEVRDRFSKYFNNQGKVTWQMDIVRRGTFTT